MCGSSRRARDRGNASPFGLTLRWKQSRSARLTDRSPYNSSDINMIQLKRAYEPPSRSDGERILVERLWPRGLAKAKAAIDLWLKDAAPGTELRKWFGHDPARWKEFRRRYWKELADRPETIKLLRQKARRCVVTFVYAAKDEEHNGALALKEFLDRRGRSSGGES